MFDQVIQVKFRLLNQPVLARGWTATLPADTSPGVSVKGARVQLRASTDWSV